MAERLTREQAFWKYGRFKSAVRADIEPAFYAGYEAGDEAGFLRGCVKTTQAQAKELLEWRQEALANSPLPQVVEALELALGGLRAWEALQIRIQEPNVVQVDGWYAIQQAEAAIQAARGAMNGRAENPTGLPPYDRHG